MAWTRHSAATVAALLGAALVLGGCSTSVSGRGTPAPTASGSATGTRPAGGQRLRTACFEITVAVGWAVDRREDDECSILVHNPRSTPVLRFELFADPLGDETSSLDEYYGQQTMQPGSAFMKSTVDLTVDGAPAKLDLFTPKPVASDAESADAFLFSTKVYDVADVGSTHAFTMDVTVQVRQSAGDAERLARATLASLHWT
jgi:hypothetical protein